MKPTAKSLQTFAALLFAAAGIIACKNHSEDYGKVSEDGRHSGEVNDGGTNETITPDGGPGVSPDSIPGTGSGSSVNSGTGIQTGSQNESPTGTTTTPTDPPGTAGEGGTRPK